MAAFNSFYKSAFELLGKSYPTAAGLPDVDLSYMMSPYDIRLPRRVLEQAEAAVRALYRLSRTQPYQTAIGGDLPEECRPRSNVRNTSVLMSYDFHTTAAGDLSLIEINTNASGFLLTDLMYQVQGMQPLAPSVHAPTQTDRPLSSPTARDLLWQSFQAEWQAFGGIAAPAVAIVDDDLDKQKMYIEFLMYKDWLRACGWEADIHEASQLVWSGDSLQAAQRRIGFVYNRLTDFFLSDPRHTALRSAFVEQQVCLSPQPREYWLLADKQRLIDFSTSGWLERLGATAEELAAIRAVLTPSFQWQALGSVEDVWSQRKQFFFKPKRAFGGKSVYRGSSVSRKVFDRIMSEDPLVQKFVPAAPFPVDDPNSVMQHWKYDLRFYVYNAQIQLVVARIYQGQVTNFSSPLGGFSAVHFE